MKPNKTVQDKFNNLRLQAETLIKARGSFEIPIDYTDPLKLIHELQTFQIELELQNEELYHSQQDLMQSQINLTELYDFAPVGYFTTNLKGVIHRANRTLADMLLTERSTLINQPLSAFVHVEDQDIYYHHLKNLLVSKPRQISELRLQPKDGVLLNVQLESTVVLNKVGDPERFRTIIIDITEHKKVEKKAKKSKEDYETIFENMAQGAFFQKANGELFDCNKAVLDQFGITRDQFMGRTSMDPKWKVIYEDGSDCPAEEHPSIIALDSGEPVRDEVRGVFNPQKKKYIWLSINAIPQFKTGQKTPYQVFVTLHDMSDRKQLLEELENANQFLEDKVKKRTSTLEEMNTALKILLQKRDNDKNESEQKIISNYKSLIKPFARKLKNSLTLEGQRNLMMILESNLKEFLEPFSQKLSDPFVNLTPVEIQIASMVKHGMSNKKIANTLNNSVRTITNHRQHIRTKLGLKNKKINLQSYLSSL